MMTRSNCILLMLKILVIYSEACLLVVVVTYKLYKMRSIKVKQKYKLCIIGLLRLKCNLLNLKIEYIIILYYHICQNGTISGELNYTITNPFCVNSLG